MENGRHQENEMCPARPRPTCATRGAFEKQENFHNFRKNWKIAKSVKISISLEKGAIGHFGTQRTSTEPARVSIQKLSIYQEIGLVLLKNLVGRPNPCLWVYSLFVPRHQLGY